MFVNGIQSIDNPFLNPILRLPPPNVLDRAEGKRRQMIPLVTLLYKGYNSSRTHSHLFKQRTSVNQSYCCMTFLDKEGPTVAAIASHRLEGAFSKRTAVARDASRLCRPLDALGDT
jgi:hypothetical protein